MAMYENNLSTAVLSKMLSEDDPLPPNLIDRYLQGVSIPAKHITLFAKMLGYPVKWFHQPCADDVIDLYMSSVEVVHTQPMRYNERVKRVKRSK